MDENNEFEKYPGSGTENMGERMVAPEEDFAEAMKDAPEFEGDKSEVELDNGPEYDKGIADAAALINYGLNAAAREIGVEAVVQKIKSFDASGRENPIKGLFECLGIDTPEECRELNNENEAAAKNEQAFREGVNAPLTRRSDAGAFKALDDMKELISEVEGADPRYEELRAGARAAGKGYFEYAVKDYGIQGLTELFDVLAQQRERVDVKENEIEKIETNEKDKTQEEGEQKEMDRGETKIDESVQKKIEQRETLNPEILRPNET